MGRQGAKCTEPHPHPAQPTSGQGQVDRSLVAIRHIPLI
jgi:hypothetical protein